MGQHKHIWCFSLKVAMTFKEKGHGITMNPNYFKWGSERMLLLK